MTIASGHIQNKGKVRYPDFEHGCVGLASSNLRMKPEKTVIGNTYRYYFGNGYVKFTDGLATLTPQYFFYSKDHLGNVRSVVTKNPNTNEITEVQQTHYYPFGGIIADLGTGRSVQNHLYNGKELDYSNNLWWYDYGARQYDPTAPRFVTPDPLAEKYFSTNYFAYCMNNPTRYIDPDGRTIVLTGTRKQRLEILGQMQKLTNDQLAINQKTGKVNTKSNMITHIGLGHEMIHGYTAMNGIQEVGESDYQYTNANGETYVVRKEDKDELMTTGIIPGYKYTENGLRDEQLYDERILYNSTDYR